MKKQRREDKGITLIALIITVVVLIILAGIGIGALVNQDGIVDKANEAKLQTEKKDIEEQINIMTIQSMDKYGNVIRETLKTKLEDLPEGKEIVDGDGYIGVIYPEYAFKIELSNGKVAEYIPPVIVDGVNIPEGYVASQVPGENTVEEGLVIYEIPEGATVNWTDNEDGDGKNQSTITLPGETEAKNLQETVNQYVWIPVDDINSMVMCSSNTGTSVCNLVYNEETDELACTTPAHSETESKLVGRLYTGTSSDTTDGDGNTIYSYTMDFIKRDQTYNTSSYHEPNTVSSDASNGLTIEQLESDFTAMAKSVAKNGGFYISRYEVGANGDSKKNQQVLTAASSDGSNYLGANKWYGLYNTIRNINENKQMIWGCQYDQVIKFLKENGEDPENGHTYIANSRDLSGQNELDCMKNIYDLEGNHREWTAEAYSTNSRALRGSDCNDAYNGRFNPASCRYNSNPANSLNYRSSRSTLYL